MCLLVCLFACLLVCLFVCLFVFCLFSFLYFFWGGYLLLFKESEPNPSVNTCQYWVLVSSCPGLCVIARMRCPHADLCSDTCSSSCGTAQRMSSCFNQIWQQHSLQFDQASVPALKPQLWPRGPIPSFLMQRAPAANAASLGSVSPWFRMSFGVLSRTTKTSPTNHATTP